MRRGRKRLAGAVAVVVAAVVLWFGWPYAYFFYRLYFHGPAALERIAVSAPAGRFRYGPAPQQIVDLRLPSGPGKFPVAVVVHGGCWDAATGGTARGIAPLADALTARGIATLNVSYREVGQPGGGWPGTMRDVGAAIDGVRALARRYPLDPGRLIVVGHSAGAQLALWSAMRGRLAPESALHVADPLLPAAVVAIDGPGTLAEFVGVDADVCGKPVIVPFMGGTPAAVPDRYRDASPQEHLPLHARQYLVQAALGDLMQRYVDLAKRSGDPVAVYKPADGKHFDIINPREAQGQGTVDLIVRAASEVTAGRAR